jgi:hypothetical protein
MVADKAVATTLTAVEACTSCAGAATVEPSVSVGGTWSVDGRLVPLVTEGETVLAWPFPSVTLRTSTSSETRVFYDALTTTPEVDSIPSATRLWASTYYPRMKDSNRSIAPPAPTIAGSFAEVPLPPRLNLNANSSLQFQRCYPKDPYPLLNPRLPPTPSPPP